MSTRNLDKLFRPDRIAVICAGQRDAEPGQTILHNLLNGGFRGAIYPINPQVLAVHGIHSYPDLAALPAKPDLAIVCCSPDQVPDWLEACGDTGVAVAMIVSAGMRAHDHAGIELDAQVSRIASRYPLMRILGPNTLGIISPGAGLNASFTRADPQPGHIALLSQSGALGNAILDWAEEKGVGLSHFISLGNMVDIDFGDLISFLGGDPTTRSIILYVQSIEDARGFMSAARAFAKSKPIVAYKGGRFRSSSVVAASHTGSLVAEDAVYEAAFQRAGVVRALELDDIFDLADMLACQRIPEGARLAIISNAASAAIVATDALLAHQGELAGFSDQTKEQIRAALPWCEQPCNPVDISDEARPEHYHKALELVLADRAVDGVLVCLTPQVNTNPTQTAEAVATLAKKSHKPVLAAWMGGKRLHEGVRILNQASLPTHGTPEQAVRAFLHLVDYARNLEILYETPRDIPVEFTLNRRRIHDRLQNCLSDDSGCLSERQSKQLLQLYGIEVCEAHLARDADEAVQLAERIGYPVVMKIQSADLLHKQDFGGVELNLHDAGQVRQAHQRILDAVALHQPEANIDGITVQRLMSFDHSFEMILGAKKDPTFGPVIMCGMGGTHAELFQELALGLPPINERLARHMLERLRFWPILQGYRGQPGADIDRLLETLIRFSYLVADYPEFQEIDINPLLVTPDAVIALDAVILIDRDCQRQADQRPYQHLAIRPYPEQYVRHAELKDGTPVTLRPIKPEDEPLWQALLTSSSPESIRFRFRSMFKHISHEMATRHCFIDYEREISIVGEIETDGQRRLIGVGGLSAEVDSETAEFAVIVTDEWQGKGLGGRLLDYCIEISRDWGVKRIIAETDPKNRKMLDSFHKRGFDARIELEDDTVYLSKAV